VYGLGAAHTPVERKDLEMTQSHTYPLADLCEITLGPSGLQLGPLTRQLDGIPVVSPPDLTSEHTITTANIKSVSAHTAAGLSRFRLQEGDLVYVRQGTLGRRAVVGPSEATWLFGAACLRIRPRREHILSGYLLHYLGHPLIHARITSEAHQSMAVETITSRTLATTPVVVPPLARQRVVVKAIDAVNAQINAHRQVITKTEAFRQGLLMDLLGDAFDESGT
jgi:type I restriction enzyme S subunit